MNTARFGLIDRGVSDEWHLDLRKSVAENDIGKKASLA